MTKTMIEQYKPKSSYNAKEREKIIFWQQKITHCFAAVQSGPQYT
jgi:hypothetical protein